MARRTRGKVIILGGGIAGLAAATELRQQAPELPLLLLEARDRPGGRIWTDRDPLTDEPLERGAEFVHGRPPGLLRALRTARLRLIEGDEPPPSGDPDDSPFTLMPRVLEGELDLPGDRSLLQALTRAHLPPPQRGMLQGYAQGFYLAPPAQLSAKAIARMERGASAIEGERAGQLEQGYQRWVNHLASHLRPDQLRLGTIAQRVRWRPGQVTVEARSLAGAPLEPLEASAAVLAVPFTALDGHPHRRGAVRLTPALPAKRKAARALRMGHATKAFLRFAQPLPFESFFFAPGAIPVWWTPVGPRSAWVVGWAGGPSAEALDRQADAAALHSALASLAAGSGLAPARLKRELTAFHLARWSREPFIEGAYAVVPPGADGAMAELAQPVAQTLFFAGEATDPDHAGTVHGAYESGRRAAREWLNR